MKYRVDVKREALKYIKKLPVEDQQRIDTAINALADDHHPPNSEQLTNALTKYRLRIGKWRILYDVSNERLVVDVVRVAPRGQVYKT